ncbi:hypothetical protein P5V15_007895 [Pogonomyrmex californicus]
MEAFRDMLVRFEHKKVEMDIIAKLPSEIKSIIFTMLDEESLHITAYVSRTWRTMYKYERKRRQLHKLAQAPEVKKSRCLDIKPSMKRLRSFEFKNECFVQVDRYRYCRNIQRKMEGRKIKLESKFIVDIYI